MRRGPGAAGTRAATCAVISLPAIEAEHLFVKVEVERLDARGARLLPGRGAHAGEGTGVREGASAFASERFADFVGMSAGVRGETLRCAQSDVGGRSRRDPSLRGATERHLAEAFASALKMTFVA